MAKNTYGTGCFLLMNTGDAPATSRNRLLTTVAWRRGGATRYALEGSVFIAGAAIQWLRDGLGLIARAADIDALAASVPDSEGVYFVPALSGLGAPYWDPHARGTIVGITRGTTKAHLARATLEAIAFQSAELIEAMAQDSGLALTELRVDGGATASNLLMQMQADLLGVPVVRPRVTETTALGAAYLAGLATGFWRDEQEIAALWARERVFEPHLSREEGTSTPRGLAARGRALARVGAGLALRRRHEEVLAVVPQLLDRLVDVRERLVLALLRDAGEDLRVPALGELLQGRDVDDAVVQVGVEERQVAHHEAAVLVDRVAAEGRGAFRHEGAQELDQARLDFGLGERRSADAVHQSGLAVRRAIPRVHALEHLVGLVDHVDRRLGDGVQLRVGHDEGDLEHAVALGNESRHFHVYPNEWSLVLCHEAARGDVAPIVSRPFRDRPSRMSASAFSAVFAVFVLASLAWRVWLGVRQTRHVARHRDEVPASFDGLVPLDATGARPITRATSRAWRCRDGRDRRRAAAGAHAGRRASRRSSARRRPIWPATRASSRPYSA
jgi:hypothetical protein